MKAMVAVLLVLIVAQVASAAPRIVLGLDPKTGERSVQLTSPGKPTYPTIDVTCDGQRRTIPLTRTDTTKSKVVAIYGVPGNTAETMLKSAKCRLLIPGQDIAIASRQIQAAWSTSPSSAEASKGTTSPKR